METDWAENRAELPPDFIRDSLGKVADVFYTTYKRDKFRSRVERGIEPGTMEIYVSQRRMEQVPTVMIDKVSPAGFAWAVMPPSPGIEAEFLTRLMVKFGTTEARAQESVQAAVAPDAGRRARAHREGPRRLGQALRRRHLRPRVAPRRAGARPRRLHRGRPRPLEGRLLRPLLGPRRGQEGHRVPVEADVLEGHRRQARAVPDLHRRIPAAQRGDRAGSERRDRTRPPTARRSSRC